MAVIFHVHNSPYSPSVALRIIDISVIAFKSNSPEQKWRQFSENVVQRESQDASALTKSKRGTAEGSGPLVITCLCSTLSTVRLRS